jgi:glycosyltransferase involved in cell wall biosynthesis
LGSASLDERRKGAREAGAAISAMCARRRDLDAGGPSPFLITYGHGTFAIEGLEVRHLGQLDEDGVITAIHASDVHLTMTREDNLPNTVMEAMACGVPVVGTNVGGLPDMVTDGVDGWLVSLDDATDAGGILARLAGDLAAVATAARHARGRAVADWDYRRVGDRYLKLMADLPRHQQTAVASGGLHPLRITPSAAAVLASRAVARGPSRRLRRLGLLRS